MSLKAFDETVTAGGIASEVDDERGKSYWTGGRAQQHFPLAGRTVSAAFSNRGAIGSRAQVHHDAGE